MSVVKLVKFVVLYYDCVGMQNVFFEKHYPELSLAPIGRFSCIAARCCVTTGSIRHQQKRVVWFGVQRKPIHLADYDVRVRGTIL